MSNDPQVIVVGAGPTGLTLAAELAGAGVRCRVIEQRVVRSKRSRAFSLTPHTLELLAMRGQAEAMIARGLPWRDGPLGVDDRSLDFGLVESRFNFMLILPQDRTEDVLERWALGAGVEVVRGAKLTALAQSPSGVVLRTEQDGREVAHRAQYVVGCDGVHSAVRALAGIPFHGSSYDVSLIIADVHLAQPPDPPVHARTGRRGMVAVFPFGDGTFRLIILDHQLMATPASQPVTLAEVTESAAAILGRDLGIHDPIAMSRYRSDQRQAARYREGRVLLAGDAAHTHIPSGGQGLQIGMQDAFNLGWKLAAEVRGEAAPGLLDSYAAEREPIGASTLRKTDLAFRYEISRAAPLRVLRWLFVRAMALPRLQRAVLHELCGLTFRYPPPSGWRTPAIVGRRAPDLVLTDGTLYEQLRARRFVVVDRVGMRDVADELPGWPRVVVARGAASADGLPEVLLVRPDGYVAWAGRGHQRAQLDTALRRWCGAPAVSASRASSARVAHS